MPSEFSDQAKYISNFILQALFCTSNVRKHPTFWICQSVIKKATNIKSLTHEKNQNKYH